MMNLKNKEILNSYYISKIVILVILSSVTVGFALGYSVCKKTQEIRKSKND